MKLQGRLILLGIAAALVGGFVYSQVYIHDRNRRELKDIAEELALIWQDRLALTQVQTSKLINIIIEFTLRKNEIINAPVSEETKVRELQLVQQKENRSLQRILTPAQFEEYRRLK